MKHSYHAHHAPLGAACSFLLGLDGAGGGFVAGAASEATQDVFVGYRYPGEPWTLLPFVRRHSLDVAGRALAPLPHGRYGRVLGWATDRWMAQAMVFTLITPFDSVVDPESLDEARRQLLLAPAVYGVLEYDNSHMDVSVELVCAIGETDQAWRIVPNNDSAQTYDAVWGEDGSSVIAMQPLLGSDAMGAPFSGTDVLGAQGAGLVFQIHPRCKAVFPIVFAMGPEAGFAFGAALDQFEAAQTEAARRDDELRASGLSEEARQRISLATRERIAAAPEGTVPDLSLPAIRQSLGL